MRTTKRIEKGEGRQRENATQDEIARIAPLALLLLLIPIRVVCHLQRHRADTLPSETRRLQCIAPANTHTHRHTPSVRHACVLWDAFQCSRLSTRSSIHSAAPLHSALFCFSECVLIVCNQPLNVFVVDEKESAGKPSGVELCGIDMQIKINKIIYVSLNLN